MHFLELITAREAIWNIGSGWPTWVRGTTRLPERGCYSNLRVYRLYLPIPSTLNCHICRWKIFLKFYQHSNCLLPLFTQKDSSFLSVNTWFCSSYKWSFHNIETRLGNSVFSLGQWLKQRIVKTVEENPSVHNLVSGIIKIY